MKRKRGQNVFEQTEQKSAKTGWGSLDTCAMFAVYQLGCETKRSKILTNDELYAYYHDTVKLCSATDECKKVATKSKDQVVAKYRHMKEQFMAWSGLSCDE